ncbi:MAG: tetratricopeptide repeat protein [Methylobacter sp.]|nr:tetratricopeptide repeat protein [Methylobacter sp.]MDP2097052.1 tetratricopeptide repeat protein [Methylobacter sp.]MDP2427990.1 tetratricopeptide repeat protein [Methylobacter sp.]MDP3055886.1 tetratricopeptide repeat protein [Methylobacter sp.]MDP3363494.1 tetratricopeptide repeat protein [Methylobacter sp.]
MTMKKPGRNDACSCGSGKKYKKCCELAVRTVQAHPVPPSVLAALQQAVALHQAGQLSDAKARYEKILGIAPDNPDALHYLGLVYYQTGDSASAVTLISKAVALSPTHLMHNHLGAALQAQGQHDSAIASYRAAIALQADYAEAYNNLGAALQEQGKLADAVQAFGQALALNPEFASAQNNLGNALLVQGNLKAAIACYYASLKIQANNLSTRSNLLLALSYYPDCTPQQYLDEARLYGNKVFAMARPYRYWPGFSAQRGDGKLRVGFVSGDFKIHPVGYFLESILQHINPEQLELVAYAAQYHEDELTARIKPYFKHWHIITGLNDACVAQTIYADGIDILVDLAGHTAKNRLAVFAWRAAPVQVSWLGFFASTGVPGVDFLLTDAVSVPAAQGDCFSEALWYLPETRLCFTPPDCDLTPNGLPAAANKYVTFACFQNLSKINDAVINVWGEIFKALPTAKLIVRNKQMSCLAERDALQQRLTAAGISADRVTIDGLLPREDYLASYADVDIMLDTFPYPGGTTTCEALWMGVPTLTLAGETLLARQGVSMLACVGLPSWIAHDERDYIGKAVGYAADMEMLSELRQNLRAQSLKTALFDASRFAKQFEQAMWAMWQQKLSEIT